MAGMGKDHPGRRTGAAHGQTRANLLALLSRRGRH
jgi:hypothetical protein